MSERGDDDSDTGAEEKDDAVTTSPPNSEDLADGYKSLLAEHPLLYQETRPGAEEARFYDPVGASSVDGEIEGAMWTGLISKAAGLWARARARAREGRWMRMGSGDDGVRRYNGGVGIGVRMPLGIHHF